MPAELSVPQEPIPSEGWADATEEERHFREGDLEEQARRHRSSRMWHLHWIGIACLWAGAVVGAVVGGVCLWHLVTVPTVHFLEADQLSRLNTIAVTSVVSVLATFFVQQVIR